MGIDGRVHESLRRQLSAARPLVIDGAHELDGCWALDRCVDESGAPTAVQQVLEDVRSIPEQRATMAVAARMAEHLHRYRWPADLVVSAVPSKDPVVELLARAVAVYLEVPYLPLLRRRVALLSPVRSADVERRIAVRARVVPAHVLLIDDLVSSGRTLRACGSALRARGAQAVWAMVAGADVRSDPSLGADRVGDAVEDEVRERGDFSDVWTDAAEVDQAADEIAVEDEDVTVAVDDDAVAVDDTVAVGDADEDVTDEVAVEDDAVDVTDEDAVEDDAVDEVAGDAVDEVGVDVITVEDEPVEDEPVDEVAVEDEPVEDEPVEDEMVDEVAVEDETVEGETVEAVTIDDETVDEDAAGSEEVPPDQVPVTRVHPRRAKRPNRRAHKR